MATYHCVMWLDKSTDAVTGLKEKSRALTVVVQLVGCCLTK